MKNLYLFMLAGGLLLPSFTFGQDTIEDNTFKMSMQFRPRFEYRNGDYRPLNKEEKPAVLINSRLRLNMEYAYKDELKTKISLQNVSLWGQANPVQGLNQTTNNIGIFEGWADLKIYKNLRTKIGRQVISLDDQRIFSIADWPQGARSHDALSLYYNSKKLDIRSFFAFNQNYNALYNGNLNNPSGNFYTPDGAQPYKYLQLFWSDYHFSPASKLSFIFSNIGYQNVNMNNISLTRKIVNLQTTGFNYLFSRNKTSLYLTGYYQFGKTLQSTDISAYLLSAEIMEKITPQLTLSIRSDYLSGNSIGQSASKEHSFNSLFGTGHKFYGHMDYFPFGDMGLLNNVITANYSVSEKIKINAAGHFFFAANTFKKNNIKYSKNMGQEIDLNLDYKINHFSNLTIGYSTFFTTENLLQLKNINNAKSWKDWAWVSLNIYPKLFKAEF